MRRAIEWMFLAILCCASFVAMGEEAPDARLLEAKAAVEEAKTLRAALEFPDAIVKAEHALSLRTAVLGETHADVAECLHLLGTLYLNHWDMARAEPLLQRAITMREATLGKGHPDVAYSLNNLANLYIQQGLYARAEPLHERALAIRETALGKHHPDVAHSLNNLAILYYERGQYSRAEPLHERALAIRETALGKQHPDVAHSLTSLANLYLQQGLYARAESFYARSLAIREAAFGKQHPYVAHSLTDLGELYRLRGMHARARPLHERSLAIRESTRGKNHPDVAHGLNNLAELYQEQGLYAQAEPLYQRALAIREEVLGQHHSDVAYSLLSLAGIYQAQGLYARAEPLTQRALTIWETAIGEHHPGVARALNNLAMLHLARHQLDSAVPLLTRAFAISEQRLRQEALDFSEFRLTSFLQFLRADEERIYSLLRAYPDDASVRRLAFTAVLLRKGRSVEEIAGTSRTIYRSLGPEDRDTFERLRGLRAQLAQLSLNGPGQRSTADHQQQLKALSEQGDALEADLAKRSAPLRALTALPSPADIVDRVAAALPPDGALIEFVAYTDRDLVPKPGARDAQSAARLHYLALLLLPDASIRALDLGPVAPIDRAASNLRDALARRDTASQSSARALYTLAFQPLLPLLGDVRRIFLAPDGQLGLIPFDALHDGQQFLLESFDFSYLTSGKDLLPRSGELPPASSVTVIADPAFDSPPDMLASTPMETRARAQRSPALERFFATLRTHLAGQSWAPLPGTRKEAEAIQRLLPQAQLLLGSNATKQRLLELAAPGVLHIATHGFFLKDAATPKGSRGTAHVGSHAGGAPGQAPTDPLLRSGIVLAGAKASTLDTPAESSHPAENALVTALEFAGFDLWGTQLVVLSACDTGRGDIKHGQGVYGLRRAFVVAGAETVVMSLWKVNDDSTRLLMEEYYRHLLAGRGRAEGLREAMQTLRKTHPHPYYWAPFIALGRDTPLKSLTPALQP